jgi:hypothetical protein
MSYTNGLDKPTDYFNTVTYTGTGSTQSITGVGFQPDWIWGKGRTLAGYNHGLVDSVRGVSKLIYSNLAEAEETYSTGVTSFDSDGFSVGSGNVFNNGSNTYVAWNWLASNTTASNTDGSITSTVSANTTSGFSIVSYAGSSSNITVGHGLGVTPKMIIFKNRTSSSSWTVYHESLGNGHRLVLNNDNAKESTNQFSFGTSPTSSVFALGGGYGDVNTSGANYIAYCFAEKTGYSKFGSYTGNGNADGSFIYTGFKPAFVMIKNTTNGNNWFISDNKRVPFNLADDSLFPNSNSAEMTTQPTNYGLDILSNGMKMRTSGDHTVNNNNASSNTYIYMAFAEAPLVGTNGVTAKAR